MTPKTPGQYLYTDPIGGEPQCVDLVDDEGVLAVRFAGMDEDDGEDIPLEDLPGDFQPLP
jgi:hypothetical protein